MGFPGLTPWKSGSKYHYQVFTSTIITELQANLGWKGLLRVCSPNSWSKQGQPLSETRFLRSLSM